MAKRETQYTRQRYMRERRRVQNMIYRLRNRGYDLNPSDVLHNIPKQNFASATKRLEQFRSQLDLAKKFLGEDTIRPPRANTNAQANIPTWYDIEYGNLRAQMNELLDSVPEKYLTKYLDMAEKIVGREKLMESIKYLEDEEGIKVTYKFNYNPALFQRYLWEITRNIDMTSEQRDKIWSDYETLLGEYQDVVGDYDDEDY